LYDRNILGGGDGVIAYAAMGRTEAAIAYQRMTAKHAEDCRQWAAGFYRAVNGTLGFVDTDILHLWHGDLINRQYNGRREILSSFDYDPSTDITFDSDCCWRWNSPKEEMHRRIREYFDARKEDGV
jgi:hypothetical protein